MTDIESTTTTVVNQDLKTCTKCGIEKPATSEFFSRNSKCKDGLNFWCKSCLKDYRDNHTVAFTPDTQKSKTCTKCKKFLPGTPDYFHKDKSKSDGLRPECKTCVKVRQMQPDKRKARNEYMKKWHSENDPTEYNSDPKNIERKAAWSKKYSQQPEVKKKAREAGRKRYATPGYAEHVKELINTPEQIERRQKWSKEYHSRPAIKARNKEYNRSDERKEYSREYRNRPEIKKKSNKKKRDLYKSSSEYRLKKKKYGENYRTRPEVIERISFLKKKRTSTDPQYRLNNSMSCAMRRCLGGQKNSSTFDILDFTIEELKIHIENQFQPGMTWDNYGKSGWEIDHKIPVAAHNFEKTEDNDFKKCWALTNLQPMWGKENAAKCANLEKPFQQSLIFD